MATFTTNFLYTLDANGNSTNGKVTSLVPNSASTSTELVADGNIAVGETFTVVFSDALTGATFNGVYTYVGFESTLNGPIGQDTNGDFFLFANDGGIPLNTNLNGFQNQDFPICYLRGTHILTTTGEVRIEDIRIGDLVVTRFGAIQPVTWIGRQSFGARFARADRRRLPVRIHAGALGDHQPARDLFVSPGHSMLIDGQLVMARSLVNGVTITQDWGQDDIHYFQIELEAHDCIIAEGVWSETFADGPGLREQFHNAAEFAELFPRYAPPDEMSLCAPRPESGSRLEKALRPIVERASVGLRPGPLRGAVDLVAEPWSIEGWASDRDHPEMPVLLEILVDDEVVGEVLACGYRKDLDEARIGTGRCAFFVTSPIRLRPETAGTVRMRRASDHAEIAMTPACLARLGKDRSTPAAAAGLRLVA